MKKLMLIATVFCLSLVSLKAEAINDKKFVSWLKETQTNFTDFCRPISDEAWGQGKWAILTLQKEFAYFKKISPKNKFKSIKKDRSDCSCDSWYSIDIVYEIKKYHGGPVIEQYDDENDGHKTKTRMLHNGRNIQYVLSIYFETFCGSSTTSFYYENTGESSWKIACIGYAYEEY